MVEVGPDPTRVGSNAADSWVMDEPSKLGPVARRLAATQRVLCVEDEGDIAAFLRAYFRAAGYDLVHVDPGNPDEVLEALDEHHPDLVLLDVNLRGFSGLDAYRRMRSDERWAFTPVIVVSAETGADPHFDAHKGLDAFVAKPFNTNVLADLVKSLIERAAQLAATGRDAGLEVMTQGYLEARLADEVAVTGPRGTFSFALVRLRSLETIVAEVGPDGRDHLVATLIRQARATLPRGAVIGVTDSDELAVIFPALDSTPAFAALEHTLQDAVGDFEFPGGATVPVDLVGGVAAYPTNAVDTDGLFMAADVALTDASDAGVLVRQAL